MARGGHSTRPGSPQTPTNNSPPALPKSQLENPFALNTKSSPSSHSRTTSTPNVDPIQSRSPTTPKLSRIPSSSGMALRPNNVTASYNLAHGGPLASAIDGATSNLPPPNPKELLLKAAGVVKSRTGSVLSRGFILKADYRTSTTAAPTTNAKAGLAYSEGGVHLRGASNFRMADLGVYGVAQPTETGLKTILSVLRSQSVGGARGDNKGRETVWFCTREEPVVYIGAEPFVLRDAAYPTETYALSDRAENLEEIENRLKQDILKEAARYGGVILVQEEIGNEILNTWVATNNVRTVRELWEEVASEGYNLSYHRVPVTRDQSPDDRYLDAYASILATIPTTSSLVFNCGVGVVRTTFAMSAALIVRRKQIMGTGVEDPYEIVKAGKILSEEDAKGRENAEVETTRILGKRKEQKRRDESLLRLMNVLQQSYISNGQLTVLSVLSSNSQLLENLRNALLGNYDLILSLLSILDDGTENKKLVDIIVDHCDALVNLRESALQHRVRNASLTLVDAAATRDHRTKALAALERYFFLICWSSYVSIAGPSLTTKFSSWLKSRPEIGKMVSRLRKSGHFSVFSPVHDLSTLTKRDGGDLARSNPAARDRIAEVQRAGGQVIGDEWARQIVRSRSGIILRTGMILKNDQWRAEIEKEQGETGKSQGEGETMRMRGAINFRRVPNSNVFGLSQPTQAGIEGVLRTVSKELKPEGTIVWMNLREEPLIMINGTPFVLRQEAVSLRNVKSYAGISSTRLELLEDRLKSDVLAELKAFDGRILIHSEANDGTINPVWEVVETESQVQTLREIMDLTARSLPPQPSLQYRRIPVTAEKSPDFSDVRELVETVAQLDIDTSAVIVNCQLGRGRSTRAQVLITLVQRWLRSPNHRFPLDTPRSSRYSYTVINNLLRTIRSGQEIKNAVDDAITACGGTFDLLDSIEDARLAAEDARENTTLMSERVQRGIHNLRAYYFLILFASFLNESKAETWRELRETASYESWVRARPVFKTIERELDTAGIEALVPLEKPVAAGNALSDEVADFVAKRTGRILSAYTLLKSDFFSGLQKMSLPERVDGAPNFRRVRLFFTADMPTTPISGSFIIEGGPVVYGSGMPTVEGLRRALDRMGAKEKHIVWTSMREEPVIYVSGGRPHVLRLYDAPLENVVTTGVTSDIVESMEAALKQDLLAEAAANKSQVLLHDETEEADGSFTVTAQWEELDPDDVMTPKEVFLKMRQEGFRVDYERLPVTDEQAPIPMVFSRIEERVSKALQHSHEDVGLVFNCQMGRGRTTTGMVAAALVADIAFNPGALADLSASFIIEADESPTALAWDGREADPYIQGEYKIILQLVGVMQHGKLAKKLTDRAIDRMEGVQNLRRAVYDFKLRAEAADAGSQKRAKIFSAALNYLYRYATLITFANYLLEKVSSGGSTTDEDEGDSAARTASRRARAGGVPPFSKWLVDRREIRHILNRRTLD